MDANAPGQPGGRPRFGAAATALAVAVLVTVVVVASSGTAPDGGIAQRRPSEGLMDAFVSLVLVLMVVSTVVAAVLLSFFGRSRTDLRGRARSSPKQTAVTLLVVGLALALALAAVSRRDGELGLFGQARQPSRAGTAGDASQAGRYEPEFAVWPVVAVLGLGLVAVLAWWLSARGRRRALPQTAPTPAEALVDVLAATLDDLHAETDPRRAVIGAYARMERSLAAAGVPRSAAEAPEEYLARVLEEAAVSRRAAGRLTALFERARFSEHEIGTETKDEAIAALEQVRDELAADEALRQARPAGVAA